MADSLPHRSLRSTLLTVDTPCYCCARKVGLDFVGKSAKKSSLQGLNIHLEDSPM